MKLPKLNFDPNSASLLSEYLAKYNESLNGLVMQDQDFHRDSGHKGDRLLYIYACCEYIRSREHELGPYDVNHLAWRLFKFGYKREAYELLESDDEFSERDGPNEDHPLWDWSRMKQLDGDHDAAIWGFKELIPAPEIELRCRASAYILIAASLHMQHKYAEASHGYELAIDKLCRLPEDELLIDDAISEQDDHHVPDVAPHVPVDVAHQLKLRRLAELEADAKRLIDQLIDVRSLDDISLEDINDVPHQLKLCRLAKLEADAKTPLSFDVDDDGLKVKRA